MSIFESMENMFNTEPMETLNEKAEFTPEQLEAQNAMKEMPTMPAELAREDALNKVVEEWECFGSSHHLETMLEKAGISQEEFQNYYTERLTEEADAAIESSRELLAKSENVSFGRGGMERNDVFLKLEDEHDCYGESARFRQIMKENGISQSEWQEYYTGTKNGIGHTHDSPLAREAAYKLELEQSKPSGISPSFGGESVEVRSARHELERAIASGNKIRIDHAKAKLAKTLANQAMK